MVVPAAAQQRRHALVRLLGARSVPAADGTTRPPGPEPAPPAAGSSARAMTLVVAEMELRLVNLLPREQGLNLLPHILIWLVLERAFQ